MKTIKEYLRENNTPRPESLLERLKWGVAAQQRCQQYFSATRSQMQDVYRAASEIDVDQLLASSAATQMEYQLILDGWRQIGALLDTPDLVKASSKRQEALVARVRAARASLPC
jgi:hypothetical protein